MKQMKIIGIISSVLLILNYLEVGLIELVFPNTEWIIKMNESLFRVIFAASMIAFYYVMARYLYSEFKVNVKGIINTLIIVQVLSTILKVAQYFSIIIPGFVFTLLYISVIIIFIVFGIKVLKLDSKINHLIKTLKTFVVSMFVAYGLVSISFILFTMVLIRMMNPETDPARYLNSIYLIYAIPYIFGLMFFLKIDKQPAVNQVDD
jgi:hypothetical protein